MYYMPKKKPATKKPAPDVPKEAAVAPQPLPPLPDNPALASDTIFVSIPAYRDPEIIPTLEDLFRKARYPQRVFVGVLQQIDEEKDQAFDLRHAKSLLLQRHVNNIRLDTMPYSEAKGPAYARAYIEKNLLEDETFFMGIDSHMAFAQNWDVLAIAELTACPAEKPMLTVYPQDYERKKGQRAVNPKLPVCFMKFNSYHQNLGLPQTERFNCRRAPKTPLPSLFMSAGFVFTLGEVIKTIPYEPLPYVFLGEEIFMAFRYWTHGVDFFTPSRHLVFHLNDRTYRALFWENFYLTSNGQKTNIPEPLRKERKALEAASVEHLKQVLKGEVPDDDLAEPASRTREEFWSYLGLNLETATASKAAYAGLTPNASREEVVCKTG